LSTLLVALRPAISHRGGESISYIIVEVACRQSFAAKRHWDGYLASMGTHFALRAAAIDHDGMRQHEDQMRQVVSGVP
jgi:hypothetical protein